MSAKRRFFRCTARSGAADTVSGGSPSAAAAMLRRMELSRIAWLTTVGICIVAAALLLGADYYGYAGVLAAVGLSAAINLR